MKLCTIWLKYRFPLKNTKKPEDRIGLIIWTKKYPKANTFNRKTRGWFKTTLSCKYIFIRVVCEKNFVGAPRRDEPTK